MKKFFLACCILFCISDLPAQDNTEATIRSLEQKEVQAVLDKDTMALKKLWDTAFVVHNPESKIVFAKNNSVDRPVLQNQRALFTRDVESVVVNGNTAISMGKETVTPKMEDGSKGKTIERRYTNIWIKKGGDWKLVARHANRICQ